MPGKSLQSLPPVLLLLLLLVLVLLLFIELLVDTRQLLVNPLQLINHLVLYNEWVCIFHRLHCMQQQCSCTVWVTTWLLLLLLLGQH
jgi:hypothetical protein